MARLPSLRKLRDPVAREAVTKLAAFQEEARAAHRCAPRAPAAARPPPRARRGARRGQPAGAAAAGRAGARRLLNSNNQN